MNPLLAPLMAGLLAPVLATAPLAMTGDGGAAGTQATGQVSGAIGQAEAGEAPAAPPHHAFIVRAAAETGRTFRGFADFVTGWLRQDRARQVRIEQHVIIRIQPGRGGGPVPPSIRDPRRGMFGDFDDRGAPRMVERRMAQCVPVGSIVAVQPDGGNRLLLFMRDQRIVSAALEKGCRAQDYYSGFLIDRTSDGQICAARDRLQSRTGASCVMDKLRQLVEIDPDE